MMSVRNVFCVFTIALCCLCSYVVAAQAEAEDLEAIPTELGSGGPPGRGDGESEASSCPRGLPPVDDKSQCADISGGRGRNDDHLHPDQSHELVQPLIPVIHTNGGHREEGSVSSGTEDELNEAGEKAVENNPHVGVVPEREASDITANPDSARGEPGVTAVDVETTSRSRETGPRTTENIDPQIEGGEALGSKAQNEDDSPAAGHGKERQITAEGQAEKLETPPQGRDDRSTGRSTTSSTTAASSTGTEENNGNQHTEEGDNGVQSTSPTSRAPTEGDAMRDTANTTNNDESTTTTTTLPPESINNKKGDADSSSSISSSVWVRVPLLIVVTLACILVC
ncbi:uncharacterized protein TM35_000451420 [Trypanosoma theileri]|uniref:Mucin-associated surface protein (MASP) n=1 Tax=Trypanosoma theileri TaxID=67003 RepID=A0A1X0NI15_9TRYP|nr:uncharacterized protein TM35_000451420 [Trypanosoma theileri]ORC84404.1 hypothetical protein TM35_000451420 [Trypanosoma theileri]